MIEAFTSGSVSYAGITLGCGAIDSFQVGNQEVHLVTLAFEQAKDDPGTCIECPASLKRVSVMMDQANLTIIVNI